MSSIALGCSQNKGDELQRGEMFQQHLGINRLSKSPCFEGKLATETNSFCWEWWEEAKK